MEANAKAVCPKCRSAMEFGVMADKAHSTEDAQQWIRGTPGKIPFWGQFRAPKIDRYQVAALRCTACSYLELYAPSPSLGAQEPERKR